MRYLVLATDYDGTLATDGKVPDDALRSLAKLRESGRRLVLVTGRELEDLRSIFDRFDLFEWVVAENGAVLYRPEDRLLKPLAERPPDKFIEALRAGIERISVGHVIAATWRPYENVVLNAIRRFGLELQVIFNKNAVMVLPSGTNKATGLAAALAEMGVSPHNVVAIGDAENDHALLHAAEASAAVSNAVPMLREMADLVTRGDHGAGVMELIELLLADDLAGLDTRLRHRHLLIGLREDGSELKLPPYGYNFLIGGTSGAGKSTFATAFLERLMEQQYQFCVIDPEGDYQEFEGTVPVGSSRQAPDPASIARVLNNPAQNAVISLVGVPLNDRPKVFLEALAELQSLRARTGRPHWILVDEAHHVLPAAWETSNFVLPHGMSQVGFVTLEPDLVAQPILKLVDVVIAAGGAPQETLANFAAAVGDRPPKLPRDSLEKGELAVWARRSDRGPVLVQLVPGRLERRRHIRKYTEGEMEADRSFYFRGPEGKLNLRAQNLILFMQIADGVDDATWTYHLHKGDYAKWFEQCIKDPDLAEQTRAIEADPSLSPRESRERIRAMIEERYTLPGSALARAKQK